MAGQIEANLAAQGITLPDPVAPIADYVPFVRTGNLLFIGTALTPDPIYHRNALKNFLEFKTASYEYYRTYPYRASQWYFDE